MDTLTECWVCREAMSGDLTLAVDKMAGEEAVYPVYRHPLCQPGPKCPDHHVLMEGGGENWTCPIPDCDEIEPDHGDHPDRDL